MELEHCCECNAETGKAGISDGSLYASSDRGPYCESCWDEVPDKLAEECDDKDAEIARLRRRLSEVESQQRRIADLEAALEIVTSSLHYEIMCRYGDYIHPAMQGKYDSDMTEVVDARKVLNSKGSE